MSLWESFLSTGKISDYLRYKKSEEGELDDNLKRSNNT